MKTHASIALLLLGILPSSLALIPPAVNKPFISFPKPVVEPKPIEPVEPISNEPVEPASNEPDEPASDNPLEPLLPDTPEPATPEPPIEPNAPAPNSPARPLPTIHAPVPEFEGFEQYDWPSLGDFSDTNEAPFSNYEGEWDLYFSEVYDVFAAEKTYLADTPEPTGEGSPFKDGNKPTGQRLRITNTAQSPAAKTVVTTFDPAQPTDICKVMASLGSYCGDGGTACACYSGTYYVPDQFNTLAAGCAAYTSQCPTFSSSSNSTNGTSQQQWCSYASQAVSFRSYCPTSVDGSTTVAFAASITGASDTTTTDSAALSASATPAPVITSTASANIGGAVASGINMQGSTGASPHSFHAGPGSLWAVFLASTLSYMLYAR